MKLGWWCKGHNLRAALSLRIYSGHCEIFRLPAGPNMINWEYSPSESLSLSAEWTPRRWGTVQYSTVQYSTVQYSTVQYSTSESLSLSAEWTPRRWGPGISIGRASVLSLDLIPSSVFFLLLAYLTVAHIWTFFCLLFLCLDVTTLLIIYTLAVR